MRKILLFIISIVAAVSSAVATPMELKNLVCVVRLADQEAVARINSNEELERLYNSSDLTDNSVYRYFHDVSYSNLSWTSFVNPAEYVDANARDYYCPESATNTIGYSMTLEGTMREQSLIKNVCAAIEETLPDDILLDGNNDGEVDNVTIVITGNSDPNSSTLLWPHQNRMYWASASLKGKKVKSYLMVFDGVNGSNQLKSGVLCHEMMHALGAYDLYSNGPLKPVEKWDLMSNNQVVPQGMTAYMRHEYSKKFGQWIPEIKTLTEGGTYTLKPIFSETPDDVAYIIKPDPTRTEYFMVEYRRKEGWDASIPSSGLICYRINPDAAGNLSKTKFEVYVFRPDGSTTAAGQIDRANFNSTVRRASFGGPTDVNFPFYTDGTRADFALTNIGMANPEGIDFTLSFPSSGVENVSIDSEAAIAYDRYTAVVTADNVVAVEIYNLAGALVEHASASVATSFEVSLAQCSRGIYIIRAVDPAGKTQSLKISR